MTENPEPSIPSKNHGSKPNQGAKPNPYRLQFSISAILLLTSAVAIYLGLRPIEFKPKSDSLISITNLDQWDSHVEGMKEEWEINKDGFLATSAKNVHLFCKTELPEVVEFEISLECKDKLDFVIGLGVPANASKLNATPRIDTWDDSMVLNGEDNFWILYEVFDKKQLDLRLRWDRSPSIIATSTFAGKTKGTQVTIWERDTETILAQTILPASQGADGIYLANKNGDLVVKELQVNEYKPEDSQDEPDESKNN